MKKPGERSTLFQRFTALCLPCVLCVFFVSAVNIARSSLAPRTEKIQGLNKGDFATFASLFSAQGPDLNYSKFFHKSQTHASLACTSCHERGADNSVTPRFPGHKACTNCHLGQFVTPSVPMCQICHVNVQSSNPPLKAFPVRFDESFNMKFDHAQHMTGSARPRNGCSACHGGSVLRGAGLVIPAGLAAHNGCYSCHTPSSKSPAGRELASCGVCHDQKPYSRTPMSARAFRYAFSHAKHGPRERLACNDCHSLTPGAAQQRQVSSPSTAEHFPLGRMSCVTCHNGRRAFGGDLSFQDCKRCHTRPTFRMAG